MAQTGERAIHFKPATVVEAEERSRLKDKQADEPLAYTMRQANDQPGQFADRTNQEYKG